MFLIHFFLSALEKSEPPPPPPQDKRSKSDSETSDSEYDSSSNRKDRTSMRPKRSQRSRTSSSESSYTTSSESESDDEAVVRMSAPSTPKDAKKDAPKSEETSDQQTPGTVIQFKKKDSQKVEEEVVLNQKNKGRKPQDQEFLTGYKVNHFKNICVGTCLMFLFLYIRLA